MNKPTPISKERLLELARLFRKQQEPSIVSPETKTIHDDIADAIQDEPAPLTEETIISIPTISQSQAEDDNAITDKYGNKITYNERQNEFVNLAGSGSSCVLIGAAGTGKTTSQKGGVRKLISSGIAGILSAQDHKHLVSGTPGIVVCAYTRRAVANIKLNMPADMQQNCITIHKLLEYQPVYYEVDDGDGGVKNKMVFEATRHEDRPLPESIHTIIFEEASMLGVDLYKEVMNACLHPVQVIFLGDIQQLPPVFGPAILGFKILELPTIELTEVYRQALESPIISLAHRILSGNPIPEKEYAAWNRPGQLKLHPWKKKISDIDATQTAIHFFKNAAIHKQYDPEEDIILIPYNKAFGTIDVNKGIATHLAKTRDVPVYEVIAGFNRHYFSVGDKILVDKEDAIITKIESNITYQGKQPQPPSKELDYWGVNHGVIARGVENQKDVDVDFMLSQVANAEQGEERVRAASHVLTVRYSATDAVVRLDKAADINATLLGYALTVHKSQGSEWRKVFFVTHQSHSKMIQRELLYTAVTRAREELYVICEPETFTKGILSQRVKGNTLAEKAEFFKGKLDEGFDPNA